MAGFTELLRVQRLGQEPEGIPGGISGLAAAGAASRAVPSTSKGHTCPVRLKPEHPSSAAHQHPTNKSARTETRIKAKNSRKQIGLFSVLGKAPEGLKAPLNTQKEELVSSGSELDVTGYFKRNRAPSIFSGKHVAPCLGWQARP